MQNLVRKLGFVYCGTIYVKEDNYPRLAFEKTTRTDEIRRKGKAIQNLQGF